MLFRVKAAIMQGLTKPTCTSQKSSWNVQKGIKTTLDMGRVSNDTFKRHHYRKKREQNIEQPQIEKKKEFLNYKIYHPLLESNVLDTNKTRPV